MKKTIIAVLLAMALSSTASAFMPMHHPAHPVGRTMYHHRSHAARPKPAPRPAHRAPPRPVHSPLPRYHSPSILPFWWYATVISHPKPVVGPVRQVEVWIAGHYETQMQPNGQSILIWVPGHYELRPAY